MNPELSNRWLEAYYSAVQFCWTQPAFQDKLIANPRAVLEQEFGFTYPSVLDLQFRFVPDQNFSAFPEFPISIFDYPPATTVSLLVPLVPPAPTGFTDLAYLVDLQSPEPLCCCMCF
ncbi:hypothetical protein [Chitinophaga sp. sic0106]|uniref:hypothetical protein n=1 Tax=Chitinophaga sp. sic0106 TaxID=2854785 RepID=UPI001C485221|nr:hypothetical protein [Chitinophaga sp. sic0106]MBV7530853.1 hypothetical protein [Chitinophaga sp. sic0106]